MADSRSLWFYVRNTSCRLCLLTFLVRISAKSQIALRSAGPITCAFRRPRSTRADFGGARRQRQFFLVKPRSSGHALTYRLATSCSVSGQDRALNGRSTTPNDQNDFGAGDGRLGCIRTFRIWLDLRYRLYVLPAPKE